MLSEVAFLQPLCSTDGTRLLKCAQYPKFFNCYLMVFARYNYSNSICAKNTVVPTEHVDAGTSVGPGTMRVTFTKNTKLPQETMKNMNLLPMCVEFISLENNELLLTLRPPGLACTFSCTEGMSGCIQVIRL